MRRFITITLVFLASVFGLTSANTTSDYSEILIFRPTQYQGGAVIFKIIVNDETIARISNGSRISYKVYSEGPIEIQLRASVYTSKTINFGLVHGEKYYIKAGYDDGLGSKLSFIQMVESAGKRLYHDRDQYRRSKIHYIEEDVSRPVVQKESVLSQVEPEFDEPKTTEANEENTTQASAPQIGWSSPVKNNVISEIEMFPLDVCIKSEASTVSISLTINDQLTQALEGIPVHKNDKCSLNFLSNSSLREGHNHVNIEVTDEFGTTASTRTIIYKKKTELNIEPKKRLALVIGNSHYQNVSKLSNPENDAKDMAEALEKLGFEIMKFNNMDYRSMKRAIGNFGVALDKYDVGLFYYAGHGVQYDGTNYLIPVDATFTNERDITYECIDAGSILSKMEMVNQKVNIVILDACRNFPFSSSWSRSVNSGGLTGMDAPAGSIIAYSTAPGRTASDGSGENGLYTEELLSYIFRPNLKVEDLFKQVRINVMKKSNNQQIPWETSSLTGDFYFNGSDF